MANLTSPGSGHRRSLRLAPALAALLAFAGTCGATDLPVYGGAGGESYFRVECPQDAYLSGFSGRAESRIEQIGIACGRPDMQASPFASPAGAPGPVGKSDGGRMMSRTCPDRHAILAVNFGFLRTAFPSLQKVEAQCHDQQQQRPVSTISFPHVEEERPVMTPAQRLSARHHLESGWQACPDGEWAAGIHGYSGPLVVSIGLVCKPAGDSAAAPQGREVGKTGGLLSFPFAR